jgi:hypothetical protein
MPPETAPDRSYRLYTLSERGEITGAQNHIFASDYEALGHAQALLAAHVSVELWQTHRLVGRIERWPALAPGESVTPAISV